MTIYEELVNRVSDGEHFYVDLEKQTIKVGKDFLVKNGEHDTSRNLFHHHQENSYSMKFILEYVEFLYEKYKYSLPSERSDRRKYTYFKALPIEEIPDKRLFVAEKREVARAKLEGYILCMILEGRFAWDEETMGKWFWQSKADKDFILLRKWIKNN